jgi:transcriptional regulator with XRE-family HTH domain
VKSFGQRLESLRKDAGISQAKMAEMCKATQAQISRYERDETEPSLSTLIKMAEALDISFSDLVSNDRPTSGLTKAPTDVEMLSFIVDKFVSDKERRELIRFALSGDESAVRTVTTFMRGIVGSKGHNAKASSSS